MSNVVKINGVDGKVYEYNQESGLISINNNIMSEEEYEPVFISDVNNNNPPIFSGIFIKRSNMIIGLNGKINPIIDSNLLNI